MDIKSANHSELRMALVFRADLDVMTRGKSEGQATHAGLEAGVTLGREEPDLADRYLSDGQPKIVLETPNLASLEKIIAKARSRGARVVVITDQGRTCFDGPTTTCALIGPMSKTDSNAITRGTVLRGDDAVLKHLAERTLERDFLIARQKARQNHDQPRWTGMSSNALVTVAFGNVDGCLPSDVGDLQACYLTIMWMPRHLVTAAVLDQLARGEASVESHQAESAATMREKIGWPGIDAYRAAGEN